MHFSLSRVQQATRLVGERQIQVVTGVSTQISAVIFGNTVVTTSNASSSN